MVKINKIMVLVLLFLFTFTTTASAYLTGLNEDEVNDYVINQGYDDYRDINMLGKDYPFKGFREGKFNERDYKPTAQFAIEYNGQTIAESAGAGRQSMAEIPVTQLPFTSTEEIKTNMSIDASMSKNADGGNFTGNYDLQYRWIPKEAIDGRHYEAKEYGNYYVRSVYDINVKHYKSAEALKNGFKSVLDEVKTPGMLEVYLAVADVVGNDELWSHNGHHASLNTNHKVIWYHSAVLIEFTDDWWIDVLVTEPAPKEMPESWDEEYHLMVGKVVTPDGLKNLSQEGKNLNKYYTNNEKAEIDFTIWNTSDTTIAAPLPYSLVAMDYGSDWLNTPSPIKYLADGTTKNDIAPNGGNSGNINFKYEIDLKNYPFELTKGSEINKLTQDETKFMHEPTKNPVNDSDLFMTLAVVADPDAVLGKIDLLKGQQTYASLTTNIMVVHIPIAGNKELVTTELSEQASSWAEPTHFNPGKILSGEYNAGDNVNINYAIHNTSGADLQNVKYAIIPFNYGSDKTKWLKQDNIPQIKGNGKYTNTHSLTLNFDEWRNAIRIIDEKPYFTVLIRADIEEEIDLENRIKTNMVVNIPINPKVNISIVPNPNYVQQKLLGTRPNFANTTGRANFKMERTDDNPMPVRARIVVQERNGSARFDHTFTIPPKGSGNLPTPFLLIWSNREVAKYADAQIIVEGFINEGNTNATVTIQFYGLNPPPIPKPGGEDNPAGITG